MNQEGVIISYQGDSFYLHILFTSRTWQNSQKKALCSWKNLCSWKYQKQKKITGKKKKKQKNRPQEEIKSTILSRKEKNLQWKRLVVAKLHADVQILNKGVASKQNLLYINFKSRFPTTNASNRPWYIHINSSFESLFWKLSIDSLSWFSAQFPVFPF